MRVGNWAILSDSNEYVKSLKTSRVCLQTRKALESLIFHKCVRTSPYPNILLFNYSNVIQNLIQIANPQMGMALLT